MQKSCFITVEGIEGAGKSTIVGFIQSWLNQHNIPAILTREPGGTPVAESLRDILLSPDRDEIIQPETELLLLFAGRKQHIAEVILPALASGKWVVSDRYTDASYAYQCGGRGLPKAQVAYLDAWITQTTQPDLTFLLDLPPALGLERAGKRGPHDRFEQETLAFFERVRNAYLERAHTFPERIHIIDASQSPEAVQAKLAKQLSAFCEGG